MGEGAYLKEKNEAEAKVEVKVKILSSTTSCFIIHSNVGRRFGHC